MMRVLIVDDSILFRRVMMDAMSALPEVTVVGQAQNGRIALQKVRELRPDLITLDMEMPEMNGLAVLEALRESKDSPAMIVVSALTRRGGELTMQALRKGAFDFITKPQTDGAEMSMAELRSALAPLVKAIGLRLGVRGILQGAHEGPREGALPMPPPAGAPSPRRPEPIDSSENVQRRMARLTGTAKPEMVLIGVSTGGPNALAILLSGLPRRLGLPVLVVQHMPPLFTQSLAENLSNSCPLAVREAVHGERALADTVYIAPGGRHMRLAPDPEGRPTIQITDDPPENNCRPAVDYLFRSVANHFSGRAMAVILTGMGNDGTLGLRLLKRHGCLSLAQDEASCVVYGMPKAAVEAGVVDEILPLELLAARIVAAAAGRSS